ncbi:MAG: DUF3592 domain-containing protein [Pseudomonadota bacterium]
MAKGDYYLARRHPDGRREISWRLWVLIWVTPVVMLVGAGVVAAMADWKRQHWTVAEAEVTHVYAWDNDAPQIFYPGDKINSPRFRYTWSDGQPTEATTGTSHTGWNFALGSRHQIRFDPDTKGDVVLVGPSEWWVARTVAVLGLLLLVPSLIGALLLLRWRSRGT